MTASNKDIDAFQLQLGAELPRWAQDAMKDGRMVPVPTDGINQWGRDGVDCQTADGVVRANIGDWIIRPSAGKAVVLRE